MKMAIACWDERVASTFDAARQVLVVEGESGNVLSQQRLQLRESAPFQNVSLLAEQGIHTLICGAISNVLQKMLERQGVHVIPFVAGSLQEITQAWLAKKPLEEMFAMPGCCGRRRYRGGDLGPDVKQSKGRGGGRAFRVGMEGMQGVCLEGPVLALDSAGGRGSGARLGQGAGSGKCFGSGTCVGKGGRRGGGGRGNNF